MNQRLPPKFEEMLRYRYIDPLIVLNQSWGGLQFSLSANISTRILRVDRPKAFLLANASDTIDIFIGNREVTLQSGFPILSNERLLVAIAENTELWAIASMDTTLFVLDMGL